MKDRRGGLMFRDRITLTSQDIFEKEFKIDAKGYRMQEVDKFLDIVIKDYSEYNNIIRELITNNRELSDDNEQLKQEIRNLKTELEAVKYTGDKEVSNVDLIKRVSQLERVINVDLVTRLSQLEKIILGSKND